MHGETIDRAGTLHGSITKLSDTASNKLRPSFSLCSP
jgi:hypothetical protein